MSDIERFICFDLAITLCSKYCLREIICPKSCISQVVEQGSKSRPVGSKAVDAFVVSPGLFSFSFSFSFIEVRETSRLLLCVWENLFPVLGRIE